MRSCVFFLSTPAILPCGGKGEACREACRVNSTQKKWLVVNLSLGEAEEKKNKTVLEVRICGLLLAPDGGESRNRSGPGPASPVNKHFLA